jgi:hypothetical protein
MARTLAQRREAEAREEEVSAQQIPQEAAVLALRKKVEEGEEAIRRLKEELECKQQEVEEEAALEYRHEVHGANGKIRRQTSERLEKRKLFQFVCTESNRTRHGPEEGQMTTKPGQAESFITRTNRKHRETAEPHVGSSTREGVHAKWSTSKSSTSNVQDQPLNSVPNDQRSARGAESSRHSSTAKTQISNLFSPGITGIPGTGFMKEPRHKQEVEMYAAIMADTLIDDDFAATELLTLQRLFAREKCHNLDVRARGLEILEHACTVEVRKARHSGKNVALVLKQAILDMHAMLKAAGVAWGPLQDIDPSHAAKNGPGVAGNSKDYRVSITSPLNPIDDEYPDISVHAQKPASILASQPVPAPRRSDRAKKPVVYVVDAESVDAKASPPVTRLVSSSSDDLTWILVTNKEAGKGRVVLQPGIRRGN